MHDHAAYQLHIKVAHFQCAFAAFAHHRKSFGQQRVQRFTCGKPAFEFAGFSLQGRVVQGFKAGFERVDLLNDFAVLFEQAFVTATENRGQNFGQHASSSCE